MTKRGKSDKALASLTTDYGGLLSGITGLLKRARVGTARAVNSILTATYWDIGRRIVEFEQGGKSRAEYGEALLERLAVDLTARHGRGFSARNVWNMKAFFLGWEILQTPSAELAAPEKLRQEIINTQRALAAHEAAKPRRQTRRKKGKSS
jgi:hypothetical protein